MSDSNDPLDNEVSASIEIRDSGVTAKSRSRLISGLDRLVGNLSDWANVRLEGDIRTRRATSGAEEKIIGALAEQAIKKLHTDPAFAERALETHLEAILRSQRNREGVAKKAIEDLKTDPPTAEQTRSGPEKLSPEIIDRLEEYASGASTEELQERWGRVLASEVRKPGTFSLKVLRIADELSKEDATLFENFAQHRIGSFVPKVLVSDLPYHQQIQLVDAGLLVDPGLGQTSSYNELDVEGMVLWFWRADSELLCFPKTDFVPKRELGGKTAVSSHKESPAVPVYILSPAGVAISSILPPVDNSRAYFLKLREQVPTASRWKIAPDESGIAKIE